MASISLRTVLLGPLVPLLSRTGYQGRPLLRWPTSEPCERPDMELLAESSPFRGESGLYLHDRIISQFRQYLTFILVY